MQKIFRTFKSILLIISSISVMLLGTSCEFDFSRGSNDNPEYALEIVDSKGVNNQGVLTVTGEVKNISDKNISKVIVSITFYNDSHEELATQKAISEDILLPDGTYKFKVNCLKKEASSYEVNVEGEY